MVFMLARMSSRRSAVAQRQREAERRTGAGDAFGSDVAAHEARQPPRDRQPEPRSTVDPRAAGVGLLEFLENQLELVRRDADARVADRDRDGPVRRLRLYPDRAALREFH